MAPNMCDLDDDSGELFIHNPYLKFHTVGVLQSSENYKQLNITGKHRNYHNVGN